MKVKIDTNYTNEVTCPWCGYKYDKYEGLSITETIPIEGIECYSCDKVFDCQRDIDVTYCTQKSK